MMRIALVDDNLKFLCYEKNLICEILEKFDIECTIDVFGTCQELLNSLQEKIYFGVFLDIDMPEITGFTLAKRLRTCAPETNIIFVSNKENLVYDSFDYEPMKFIRKEYAQTEIEQAVHSLIKKHHSMHQILVVKMDREYHKIFLSNIYYLESRSPMVEINTAQGSLHTREKLVTLEKKLALYDFIRIHRGILVNMQHIKRLDHQELIMQDGAKLPVSRRETKNVRARFNDYLRKYV